MTRVERRVQAGRLRCALDHIGYGLISESFRGDLPTWGDCSKDRALGYASSFNPCLQCLDGARIWMQPFGNGDNRPFARLVGLTVAQVQRGALTGEAHVGTVEAD